MVITSVVLVLFSSVAPWFHVEGKQTTYYCKDSFLWVFLIPPLTCLPLLLASTPRVRLCWWHCWTVTVISLGIYTLSSSIPTIFFSFLITFFLLPVLSTPSHPVTVVPAAVVFVSFGASLVYTGSGAVLWGVGAFFIMISYITCILAGLLYMKLAHIIEVGPPHGAAQAEPLPGPITVCIHADPSDKYDFDDNGFRLSPSLPGPAMN